MAKGTKTGGRQKGTPNKNKVPAQELAEKLGVDPLAILLMVAKGDWKGLGYSKPTETKYSQFGQPFEVELIPLKMRIFAASDAVQYIVPKRKALEVSNDPESDGFKVIIEEYGKK